MSTDTPIDDLYVLNDTLSAYLADRGITLTDTQLDDLTHQVDGAIVATLTTPAPAEPEPEPEQRTLRLVIPVYAEPGRMPTAADLAEGIATNVGSAWFDRDCGDGYWLDETWGFTMDGEEA